MNRDKIIQHVVNFLMTEFPNGIQMFNSHNTTGDKVSTMLILGNEVEIDYCEDYDYVEVFGLSEPEFQMVKLIVDYKVKIVDTRKEA